MKYILVIDDDSTILSLLYEYLLHLGYTVEIAHNGDDGIKLFNNGIHFDLVITDINMPILDGNEVARFIRNSDTPETPVIAITGSYHDIINRELFDFVLLKPFNMDSLKDIIITCKGMGTHSK